MILEEEFDNMFQLVSCISTGALNASQILSAWVGFLEKLKGELKEAPEEEKKLVRKKLKNLSEQLNKEILSVVKNSGVPLDQLRDVIDNPDNFEPKQWGSVKSSQKVSGVLATEIGDLLAPSQKEGAPPSSLEPPKKKALSKGTKARKRSGWVRS